MKVFDKKNNVGYLDSLLKGEFKGKGHNLDFNNDGVVDDEDIKQLKDYLEGNGTLTDEQIKEADINEDGKVDNKDLVAFVNLINERRNLEDDLRDLQQLYESLLEEKNPAHTVLGVNNSNIDEVRTQLDTAKARLAAINGFLNI